MPSYTNEEYTDMHFCYGVCNGNATAAQREYANRFPNRHIPSSETFTRVNRKLRENGSFCALQREGFRDGAVDEAIVDHFLQDPETSTRAVARSTGVSQWKVWSTVRRERLYPYHYSRVQELK